MIKTDKHEFLQLRNNTRTICNKQRIDENKYLFHNFKEEAEELC